MNNTAHIDDHRLTLASASPSRAALLRQLVLDFDICPSDVDEAMIKKAHHGAPDELAMSLARAKAAAVSRSGYVLGADQILVCDGRLFDKPISLGAAAEALSFLSGRQHALINALSLYHNGSEVWSFQNAIELTMRPLSQEYIDAYLAAEGPSVLSSVGAYKLEGRGPLLFSDIQGDYFSILGLPLLPLLEALRHYHIVEA